jgi:hypothetical protein
VDIFRRSEFVPDVIAVVMDRCLLKDHRRLGYRELIHPAPSSQVDLFVGKGVRELISSAFSWRVAA